MKKSKTMEDVPEFMTTRDLIDLGIYSTIGSAFQARKTKRGPDYIQMRRKVLYKKQAVIDWIEKRTIEGYIEIQCTKEEKNYLKDQCTLEEREEIIKLIGEGNNNE